MTNFLKRVLDHHTYEIRVGCPREDEGEQRPSGRDQVLETTARVLYFTGLAAKEILNVIGREVNTVVGEIRKRVGKNGDDGGITPHSKQDATDGDKDGKDGNGDKYEYLEPDEEVNYDFDIDISTDKGNNG